MFYGKRVRELRENYGVTQKEIADVLGISNTLYSDYENENQTMPTKYLVKLANYYNVTIDFIFEFTDNIGIYEKRNFNYKLAGSRLKEFRKINKITQEKLARFLNTTHSVISDYERGRYLIAASFLYAIAKKYKVSADYLLGISDNPKLE